MENTYTTISGDTWDMIAKKVYGDEYNADVLMAANPEHIETFCFSAGVIITVPKLTEEVDGDLPPWKFAADEEDEDEDYTDEYEVEDD